MVHVILVHGMNANGESWNNLGAHSELSDHVVETVTLMGHDEPAFPDGNVPDTGSILGCPLFMAVLLPAPSSTPSMKDYIDSVVSAFPEPPSEVPEPKDVCLVGHSMGGAVISHVAAAYPERVRHLIYVSAMLPDHDQSINELMGQVSMADGFSPIGPCKEFGPYLPGMASALVRQPKPPRKARFDRTAKFDEIPIHYV